VVTTREVQLRSHAAARLFRPLVALGAMHGLHVGSKRKLRLAMPPGADGLLALATTAGAADSEAAGEAPSIRSRGG